MQIIFLGVFWDRKSFWGRGINRCIFCFQVLMPVLILNTRSDCWDTYLKVWSTFTPMESCTGTWRYDFSFLSFIHTSVTLRLISGLMQKFKVRWSLNWCQVGVIWNYYFTYSCSLSVTKEMLCTFSQWLKINLYSLSGRIFLVSSFLPLTCVR